MEPTDRGRPAVRLDGGRLTLTDLRAVATGRADVVADPAALGALASSRAALLAARDRGAVYGANTGVGANRTQHVPAEPAEDPRGSGAQDPPGHALRLLRSHCGGVGPAEDDVTARATMVVRLNQLLAAGSGIGPELPAALLAALRSGAVPALHRWGSIGTADLSALAELALTLVGERAWRSGHVPPVVPGPTDALPFLSSSALTLATAGLAVTGARELLRGSLAVAALSFGALRGNAQAYDAVVHAARPHPAQEDVAAALRTLVAGAGEPGRLQDPFGLRALPQVLAPALDAVRALEAACTAEISAASENPFVTATSVHHHGQFHAATLAAALDRVRATLFPVLALSAARLGFLLRPEHTGQRAFLADGPAGSSGLMVSEYVVQDVLAEVRATTSPTTAGTVSISLGLEEHASFATQGARALARVVEMAPTVVGAELLAAVRVQRADPGRRGGPASRELFALVDPVLGTATEDRPLDDDLSAAVRVLPQLAATPALAQL